MDASISSYWGYMARGVGLAVKGVFVLIGPAWREEWGIRRSQAKQFSNRLLLEWQDPALAVYCNEENGIAPTMNNGAPYMPGSSTRWRAYVWSAWRNPANNQRFLTPGATRYITDAPTVTNRGIYKIVRSGELWCVWIGSFFRFGWLVDVDAKVGDLSWPVFENTHGVPPP